MCSTCKTLTVCVIAVCLLSVWLAYGVLPEAREDQVITYSLAPCPECNEAECQPVIICNCSSTATEEKEWWE